MPLEQVSLADYVILPPNQPPTDPAHTVVISFIERTAIYANTDPAEQAAFLSARAEPGDLILLNADTPLLRHYTGPGTLVSIAGMPTQAAVAERLSGLLDDHSRIWLVSDPAAAPITTHHLRQSIKAIATPVASETIGSATITRYTIHSTPISDRQSLLSTFGHQINLIGASLPINPVDRSFDVFLRWQVPSPTPTNLHFSLHMVDTDGHQWDDVGQLMLNDFTFPTTHWDSGAWSDQSLKLSLPERIPPDTYTVRLTVTDDAGAQLGAWDGDGAFQGVSVILGQVEIAPPVKLARRAPCLEGQEVTAEPFVACIAEPPPQAIPSGGTFAMTVMWSATTSPEADYRVRWRLTGGGLVALEHVAPLSPYTTSSWRQDDSFDARYTLRIDPAVPAGDYDLTFNVIDPNGDPLWANDEVISSVDILHRDRQFDLPDDIGHPLDLTLGDTIHLRGFDISPLPLGEGAGMRAQPGDALPLPLYWQGDGPTDIDYTVFVHLVGPDGLPHGQLDYFPGGGSAPTSSWAPGQVVVDERALPIADDAAPGTYHIAVGLYDAASGGRLPITDGSGQRLPNDQIILPVEITVGSGQ